MDILDGSWAEMKAVKARDSFSLYYIELLQGTTPETYKYTVFGANTHFYFKCNVSVPADVADFEANFKAAATAVESLAEGVTRSRTLVSQTGSLTTNSTTALQTVLTYTVPAKKTFHLKQWLLAKINAGTAVLTLSQIQVNGSVVDGESTPAASNVCIYERNYCQPLPMAVAGDVITVKVTPSATGSTLWGARLIGELR